MLRENDHGAETGGDVPNKASVDGEPFDVAFIAAVEEDGALSVGTHPVIGVYQVPFWEFREVREAEVVEILVKISGLVLVLLPELGFDWV